MSTADKLKEKQARLQELVKQFDQLTQQRQQLANEMLKLQGGIEALQEMGKEQNSQ